MNSSKNTLIIFGASGNLSQQKLIPVILNNELFRITRIVLYSRNIPENDLFSKLKKIKEIEIIKGEYTDKEKLRSIFKDDSIVIHFALPSDKQLSILEVLETMNRKIVVSIDKPHFHSKSEIKRVKEFKNLKILLIDHFLVKDTFLRAIHLEKEKKEKLFFDKKIKKFKFYAIEDITAQNRKVFDSDGIIKDMISTHLFNLYDHIFEGNGLKDLEFVAENYRGQYENYEFESETSTCSFLTFYSRRGHLVEFLAGKALSCKKTGIDVVGSCGTDRIEFWPGRSVRIGEEFILNENKRIECQKENVISLSEMHKIPKPKKTLEGYDKILTNLIQGVDFPTVPFDSVEFSFGLFDEIQRKRNELKVYAQGADVEDVIGRCFFE